MKPVDLYLFGYNAIQVVGWGSILLKTVFGLFDGLSYKQIYNTVEWELQVFQTAAILEIVHAVMGIVKSPIATVVTQVFSRVFVVWCILNKVPSSRDSIGVPMLLVAWSITEVVRYSFYALNLLNAVPHFLVWCRYTFFIALYPLGASGEVITMLAALNEISRKKHYTIEMPNAVNMGFSFYHVVIALALYYLPGFPPMYTHMFNQRKKVLGGGDKNKKVA
ncbi:Very-long-chain (3R)-3-hydroxyacyl-CoA dehydratase [Aphelenchoides besseyi]|nr:Very-long-chain (3R)-3-hydroxyacyl-CoA dehydratase [Aphelenchoides besseyi]